MKHPHRCTLFLPLLRTLLFGLLSFLLPAGCAVANLDRDPPEESAAYWGRTDLPVLWMDRTGESDWGDGMISAEMRVYENRSGGTAPFTGGVLEASSVAYRIRGQSSGSMPKKSLALETRLSGTDEANNMPLLGLPADNDWVLHASYSDKSLMRNYLVYTLGAAVGADRGIWQPRVRHFELYYCGFADDGWSLPDPRTTSFQGIYLLTEKVKRGKNRVDIADAEGKADPEKAGYLLKIDKAGGTEWYIPDVDAANLSVADPDSQTITAEQQLYIQGYIQKMEAVMKDPVLRYDARKGYGQYLDKASFIDFFLMNEFSKNIDGYRISSFMTKDAGGKLRAGPLWDFDIALGNADYYEGADTSGWNILLMLPADGMLQWDGYKPPFWWQVMLADPEFVRLARARWKELRAGALSDAAIAGTIALARSRIGPAIGRETERWPRFGQYDWPNVLPIPGNDKDIEDYTWEDHVGYLENWIHDRLAWMDSAEAWSALKRGDAE
jgi:CotH protein.